MTDRYEIRNMVRALSSRVQRKLSPMRHRAVVHVLGQRVLPQAPIFITAKQFAENQADLITRVRTGELSIVRPDRVIIDSLPDGTLVYMAPNGSITLEDPSEVMIVAKVADESKPPVDPNAVTSELPSVDNEPAIRLCIGCRTNAIGLGADEGWEYCADCSAKIVTPGTSPVESGKTPEAAATDVVPGADVQPEPDVAAAESTVAPETQLEENSDKSKKRGKKQR